MSFTYGTSTVLFDLKILPFQHGLLLWSSSHETSYGHSADNVRENASGYGLGLIVLVLSENYDAAFIVVSSSATFFHGTTIILLFANPKFYQIYYHFRITVKVFIYLINFVWMFTFKSICIFQVTA